MALLPEREGKASKKATDEDDFALYTLIAHLPDEEGKNDAHDEDVQGDDHRANPLPPLPAIINEWKTKGLTSHAYIGEC